MIRNVFNGPSPTIHSLESESEEIKTVGNWFKERTKNGLMPHEFGHSVCNFFAGSTT